MAGVGSVLSSLLGSSTTTLTPRVGSSVASTASTLRTMSVPSTVTAGTSSVTATAVSFASSTVSSSTSSTISASSTVIVVTQTVTSTNSDMTFTVTSTTAQNPAVSVSSQSSSSALSSTSLLASTSTTPVTVSSSSLPSSALHSFQSTVLTTQTSSQPTSSLVNAVTITSTNTVTATLTIQAPLSSSSVSAPPSTPSTSSVSSTSTLTSDSSSQLTLSQSTFSQSTSPQTASSLALSSQVSPVTSPAVNPTSSSYNVSSIVSSSLDSAISTTLSASSTSSLAPASFSSTTTAIPINTTISTASSIPSSATTPIIPSPSLDAILTFPGVMNPLASNNVAAYFGHATGTYSASLADLCNSTNVDIIIIGFVRWWWPRLYYPDIDFHKTCDSTVVGTSKTTPKCPQMATWISNCQLAGKKILLSIGGSVSNTTFSTAQDAIDAATTLWYFFGEGAINWNARPFGPIILDGIDVDIETGSIQYYDVFATTLRQMFSQGTKRYFISAAPSCNNRTATLPTPLGTSFYQQTDFIWPRFYNSAVCSIGSAGFNSSVAAWASYVSSIQGWAAGLPKLYVSGYSWNFNKAGYVDPATWPSVIHGAMNIAGKLGVFGGTMLWDGTMALQNVVNGADFLNATKAALNATVFLGN